MNDKVENCALATLEAMRRREPLALVDEIQVIDAVVELREQALNAARFLDALGRNDRAQPLRNAAHRIAPASARLRR